MCQYNELCSNGWVREGAVYRKCECIRDKKVDFYFKRSETPASHYLLLEDMKDQAIKSGKGKTAGLKSVISTLTGSRENIDNMIENQFRIVLKGSNGSGKTQTAVTMALEMLRKFDLDSNEEVNKFFFLSISSLKENIFNNEEKMRIRKRISNSQILILDDLGTEIQTKNNQIPYIMEYLNDVIRSFTGIIIITTNLNRDLREEYKQHNTRLANVLVNSSEAEHGETNNLFYEISLPSGQTRRKKKNTNVQFI